MRTWYACRDARIVAVAVFEMGISYWSDYPMSAPAGAESTVSSGRP